MLMNNANLVCSVLQLRMARSPVTGAQSAWLATISLSDCAGWGIATAMIAALLEDLQERVKDSKFFSVTIDESSANDHAEYLSLLCSFEKGRRINEFLLLKKVSNTTASASTSEVVEGLTSVLEIPKKDLRTRLVGFGSDGASAMVGINGGVATQLKTS